LPALSPCRFWEVRFYSCRRQLRYQAIEEGKLRRDLFYRLGVVSITIPPLRERKEDIPLLANSFCLQCNEELCRKVSGIDGKTLQLFQNYSWPGNVRELQHAIEHAMNILPDTQSVISPKYLPRHLLDESTAIQMEAESQRIPRLEGPLDEVIRKFEYGTICQALRDASGNVSEAARLLKIDRQKLQYRINRYQIDVETPIK